MNMVNIKKNLLKKLFFTKLTSEELKTVLEVDDTEFYNLLNSVKEELGLGKDYYRTPQSYDKYNPHAYFIELKKSDGEVIINGYYNNYDTALELKKEYETGNNYQDVELIQANDENMIRLLYHDYDQLDSSSLMKKYQLPYQQYYRLLKKLKKTYNIKETRTTTSHRYIYEYQNLFQIKKKVDKTQYYFGSYNSFETAKKVRDYLENHDWNIHEWEENKKVILDEIGVEPPNR